MRITKDLKKLLIEYTIDHPKKFRKFVKVEYLFTKHEHVYKKLCVNRNPAAIKLIEKNIISYKKYDLVEWGRLSANYSAIHLLEMNSDKIVWENISCNPLATHLLYLHPEKINWDYLTSNETAIKIIEQKLDSCVSSEYNKINWNYLSFNFAAIHILEKNMNKINWENLSLNPAAIHLLEKNLEKIDWKRLSMNTAAIHILEKNPDKIIWEWLSGNPAAIHILKKNLDKIDNINIFTNYNIFIDDRKELKTLINKYRIINY